MTMILILGMILACGAISVFGKAYTNDGKTKGYGKGWQHR